MSAFDLKVANKFINLSISAEKRGITFDLTLRGVENLLRAKKCFYTNEPLTDDNRSIDRIDNSKGYVTGNVAACTKEINMQKGNLSMKNAFVLASKIKQHIQRGKNNGNG